MIKLPKEIQELVDLATKEDYSGLVTALFAEVSLKRENGQNWEEAAEFLTKLKESINFEMMESKGGGEGEGEYCYSVIKINDKFFKAEWSYYSYNGCDYDDIEATVKEVTPKEELVIVYS